MLHWFLIFLAGIFFASPVILGAYREYQKGQEAQWAADLAVEYESRLGLTLGEAVTPVADLLGHIAEAKGQDRARLQGQLAQKVVDACAELCRAERSRASFFASEGKAIRRVAWAGRTEAPRSIFVKGEPEGEVAHRLLESRRRLLVRDTRHAPEDVHVRPDADYATFLSVPVYGGTRPFGILSVDAPEPGSLDESDLDIATALAQLLGAGLRTT